LVENEDSQLYGAVYIPSLVVVHVRVCELEAIVTVHMAPNVILGVHFESQ
jgi:hypothetical protein